MDFSNLQAVMQQMQEQGLLSPDQPKEEEAEKTDMDTSSVQLSFILQQIAPLSEIKSESVKRNHDAKRTVVQEQFQDVNDVQIERYGAQIEGLETPPFAIRSKIEGNPRDNTTYDVTLDESDFHWLMLARGKKAYYPDDSDVNEGKFIIETEECEKGFVRLRIRVPEDTKAFKVKQDDKLYISATEICKEFEETMQLFNKRTEQEPKKKESSTETGSDKEDEMEEIERIGESMTIKEPGESESNEPEKNEDVAVDWEWQVEKNVLLCFHAPNLPKTASQWKARERLSGWPSPELIDNVVGKGCVLVPKAHRNSQHKDIEWQLYIPMEELLNSLNDTQQQCFILLKLLHHQFFAMHDILTPTHMTMLLFWVLEKIPQSDWTDAGLAKCVNACLDQLLQYVTAGNMPHYFFDDFNIIEGTNAKQLDQLAKKIKEVGKDLAEAFYKFSDYNLTSYSPTSRSYRELFADMTVKADSPAHLAVKQHQCLQELGQQLLKDRRWAGAAGAFDRFCQLDEKLTGRKLTSEIFLSQHALRTSLDDGILCYQFMISHYPRSESLHSHYGNMGCFYHGKYSLSDDKQERKDYMEKANEAFTNALDFPRVSAASRTDYANFCLHIEQYAATAITQAQQVLKDEKDVPPDRWAGNSYGEGESKTVPEEIQPWIALREDISVFSIMYSHYILIKSYLKTKRTDEDNVKEARKILRQMRAYCAKIRSHGELQDGYYESSHFLLGYAAKALEKFKVALEAFTNLQEKIPSELCQTNLEECQALVMSLEGEEEETEDEEEPEVVPSRFQEIDTTGTSLAAADDPNMQMFKLQQEIELMRNSIKKNIADQKFPDALKTAEELSDKLKGLPISESEKKTAEQLMFPFAMATTVTVGIDFCQFLIDKFPSSPDLSSYYGYMACLYHVQYAENEAAETRDELRLKAKQAFEEAQKLSSSPSCDYATFFCDTKQYGDAIGQAEGIISEQLKRAPEQWHQTSAYYNKTVAKTVDANLQAEIEYAETIDVVPIIYAYYLLINCCVKLEKKSDAEGILTRMKNACEKLVALETTPAKYKCSSQSLLGYAAKEVDKLEMAQEAFQWVCDNCKCDKHGQTNTLAQENVEMCSALLLSLQMETE